MKSTHPFLPSAAFLLSAALWGSVWIPVHVVRDAGLPGTWIAFLAYGLPAFILAPWSLRNGPGQLMRHWRILGLIGLFTGVCNVLYAIGIAYADVAMVILLFYVNPVWSALLEWAVLKTRIKGWRACAILIGLAGMWVLVAGDGALAISEGGLEWVGLLAGLAWAAALVTMRIGGSVDHMDKAFSQYVFGLVIGALVVIAGIFPGEVAWSEVAWPRALFWVLATGCLWVLPGMLLSFWGAARVSPTKASMLFMTEVLVGVGSAALLGESELDWRHLVGGGMIIAAGILDGVTDRETEAKATT